MIGKRCFLVLQSGTEKILKIIENNYIPIMLFSLALLLHSLALNVPYSKYDEDFYGNVAAHILENPLNPLSPDPNIWTTTHGPIFPYLMASNMYLFGDHYISTRIMVALMGSISVLVIYFFVMKLFGKKIGVMTALLIAVSPEHWSLSMQAITDIPFFLFFICSIYFIYMGIENNKNMMMWLGGIFSGLSILTSYTGLMIIPIFFLYLLLTGRIRLFFSKRVFLSIVIIPLLMTGIWLLYMLANPGSITNMFGISAYLTFGTLVPRYQVLGNLSVLLLLGVFPLAYFPYTYVLKQYFSPKYVISGLIVFYLIAFFILRLIFPPDVPVHGAEGLWAVESLLNHIHPALFNLAKLLLYLFSIVSMIGFFISTYVGAKNKKNEFILLGCWAAIIILFVLVIGYISYPRYLLPALPAFFIIINLELENFSKKGLIYKQVSSLIFIALMLIFLIVGFYKAFSF